MKETVFLNNDREMPLLGLGVYKLPDDVQAEAAVTSAISAGYQFQAIRIIKVFQEAIRFGQSYFIHGYFQLPIFMLLFIKMKKALDVPLPNAEFPERIFSSPAKSGTMRSVSAMSRELFPVVSTV